MQEDCTHLVTLIISLQISDLENLNPKTDGIRLGHSVGTKKEIMAIVFEKKFKVFNARVTASGSKS